MHSAISVEMNDHPVERLLLNLLSPIREVNQADIDSLDAERWSSLMIMVKQHRLAPLLHWQLNKSHSRLALPEAIRSQLAKIFHNATLRSLAIQRELLVTHQILTAANIPYVALKGAYLAYLAYPQPGLRPLRDLDILVPKQQALLAYRTLIQAGFSRIEEYSGTPDAAILHDRHLPALRSANNQIEVELHVRLFDDTAKKPASFDLSDDPDFWARCNKIDLGEQAITFESPTDLLFHLIIHAVYDHQFDNGPLLLADLAFLINSQTIDWPLFWSLAERAEKTRGCVLALLLTERYWQLKTIDWSTGAGAIFQEENPDAVNALDTAATLMLRDYVARVDVKLNNQFHRAEGKLAKCKLFIKKAFPHKIVMARGYPVHHDDWRLYGYYPIRWWHLLTERLPKVLHHRQQSHFSRDSKRLIQLEKWLNRD